MSVSWLLSGVFLQELKVNVSTLEGEKQALVQENAQLHQDVLRLQQEATCAAQQLKEVGKAVVQCQLLCEVVCCSIPADTSNPCLHGSWE